MLFRQYTDVKLMYADTSEVLSQHEAQNLILLGNLVFGCKGTDMPGWRNSSNWFMATVSDDAGIRLTALMTPPHNLTLFATDNDISEDALRCLIDAMDSAGVLFPGLMTEVSLANHFIKLLGLSHSGPWSITRRQRIYALTQVSAAIARVGTLRQACGDDAEFLPGWFEGFYVEDFDLPMPERYGVDTCEQQLSSGHLHILEVDGQPVSMASRYRSVQSVCGISYVYTPPALRRRGYGSSCVANVSQLILDHGFTSCALYTDLANPISNSIYQQIGYRPVCDSVELSFDSG